MSDWSEKIRLQGLVESKTEEAFVRASDAHYWKREAENYRDMAINYQSQVTDLLERYQYLVQTIADGRALQPSPPIYICCKGEHQK